MKFLIASDLHGSAYYCEKLFEAVKREKADRLILLGDLLYHGPRNNLPKDYDTFACTKMLNEHKDIILAVRGNCDAEVDQMVLEFPIMADQSLIQLKDRQVLVTHGHLFDETKMPAHNPGDIILHGHTHVQRNEEIDDFYYFNPGSLSIPKEDSVSGYMTLEDECFKWKNIDGDLLMERSF